VAQELTEAKFLKRKQLAEIAALESEAARIYLNQLNEISGSIRAGNNRLAGLQAEVTQLKSKLAEQ
jgi:hypothetical protein